MSATIVFDMDGVLAEVTQSYRAAIIETVASFTGRRVSQELIQDYKNEGGWNNDWLLSQKIASDLGVNLEYNAVVDRFNELFLGRDGDGLIQKEQWIPHPGLLDRLGRRFSLSLFTGRLRYEAEITLRRFAPEVRFDPVICADDVAAPKPAPDGLLAIQKARPGSTIWYVGDTVDDARSATAARVPFIGIVAPSHLRRAEIIRLFERENTVAILENVNQIETVDQIREAA